MKEVDARGLSCPIPVMRTEEAILDQEADITVLVDSGTAKQNVANQLKDAGYSVEVLETDDGWKLAAKRS